MFKEIHRDMARRMESVKRWLGPSKDTKSPKKKQKGSAKKKEGKSPSSPPTRNSPSPTRKTSSSPRRTSSSILLSLANPTYKEVMHNFFKKLGPKKSRIDESMPTEAEEAVEVLREFKRMMGGSAKFMRRENWRDHSSDHVQIDDDEAVRRIKTDLMRRNESMKQWMDKKPSTPTPKSPPPKKKVESDNESDDDSDTGSESTTPKPSPRTLRKKKPLNYANSGAEIESKVAAEVEAERTAAQRLSKNSLDNDNESDNESDDDSHSEPSESVSRSLRKKRIINYANSGAQIESKVAAQVEVERTAKQTASAKYSAEKDSPPKQAGLYVFENDNRIFYDISGKTTKFVVNDIVISLRDHNYRQTLLPFYQRLGIEQVYDKNKLAADEVMAIFKEQKGGRFFKPNGRGKDADCEEVDEAFALQNIFLDIKRRTDSTWWLDEKDALLAKNKQSSNTAKKAKRAKPNVVILTSLSDLEYRTIMETEFRKLGTKTGSDKREPLAAEELFNRLKRDGAVFYRLENPRDVDSARIQMTDKEAYKKIRTDIQRRMESAKRWLSGGVNSKSYSEMKQASQPKAPPSMHSSKKREAPAQTQLSSQPRKKAKTSVSISAIETSRHSERVRRSDNVVTGSSMRGSKRLASAVTASVASTTRALQTRSQQVSGSKPKICFCGNLIDTMTDQSFRSLNRGKECIPDYFDPKLCPAIPAYNDQIYIPGNEVYARWLNEDDPSSYGTWYPGFVYSSKLSNTNIPGNDIPKLLYHVKYHDGAEGIDIHAKDVMMREQYEEWLRSLEKYYSLPQIGNAFTTSIPKGARVYAQWNDPTDPDAHGSWLQGTVRDAHGSTKYHVRFDNGDEDDDMGAEHVLLDGVYAQLLAEKMKNQDSDKEKQTNDDSGFLRQRLASSSRASALTSLNKAAQKPSTAKFTCKIATEDLDLASNNSLLQELQCDEVFDPVKPIARSGMQGIHYGIYIEAKPITHFPPPPQQQQQQQTIAQTEPEVEELPKRNTNSVDVTIEDLRCEETLV